MSAPLAAHPGNTLKIQRFRFNARGLRHYLKNGGVIAYPTESVFGLGCDPANRAAVKRILQIKGRPQHKGLILLADRPSALQAYIAPVADKRQLQATWPGPHTWLIPTSKNCPKWLTGRHQTIAARVTANPFSSLLCKNIRMAIVSTSANRSGCQPARTTRECYRLFGGQVRVLQGRTGGAKKPSTIQDLASGRIIRP